MTFNKHDFDNKQRFSIRKLSIGVCSVLLSTLFLTFNDSQTVHADTENNGRSEENQDEHARQTKEPSQVLHVDKAIQIEKRGGQNHLSASKASAAKRDI